MADRAFRLLRLVRWVPGTGTRTLTSTGSGTWYCHYLLRSVAISALSGAV